MKRASGWGATASLAWAALFLGAGCASAQQSEELWIEVGACLDLESMVARFECYERRVEQAVAERGGESAEAASERPGPSPADAAAPADARGAGDGRSAGAGSAAAEAARAAEPAVEAEAEVEVEGEDDEDSGEIRSTIVSLRERLPNEYIITLENGQVWHQIVAERYRLRVGQSVRISPTNFFGGSYHRLSADGVNGFIRVERVR